jgi:hypothetical protein
VDMDEFGGYASINAGELISGVYTVQRFHPSGTQLEPATHIIQVYKREDLNTQTGSIWDDSTHLIRGITPRNIDWESGQSIAFQDGNGGYLLAAGGCSPCAAGTFKPDAGDEACTACPSDSTSPPGSQVISACQCNPGFTGPDGGSCAACAIGSAKDFIGAVACTVCTAFNEYTSATGTPDCQTCPSFAVANEDHSDCICVAGYTGGASGCTPCSTGAYKDSDGNHSCTQCPWYSTSIQAASSIEACFCTKGHTGNHSTFCTPCAAGTYKAATGSASCTTCGMGKFLENTGSTQEADCLDCLKNTYQDESGSSECHDCPLHSSTLHTQSESFEYCICSNGRYMTDSTCAECPADNYCENNSVHPCTGNATAATGSPSPHDCTCKPGFYAGVEIIDRMRICVQCETNHFCTGNTSRVACPAHSSAPAQSISIESCICGGGYREL